MTLRARCQCPIYNGYLHNFARSVEWDIHVFLHLNCLFSLLVSLQRWLAHFVVIKKQRRKYLNWTIFKAERRRYFPYFWSDFKDTILYIGNSHFSMEGHLLEITLAAPLMYGMTDGYIVTSFNLINLFN